MKIFTSYFYQVRNFNKNIIPISTGGYPGGPAWFVGGDYNNPKYVVDKNNVMLGLYEPLFHCPQEVIDKLEYMCQKDCPHRNENSLCPFLKAYEEYLDTLDFNYIMNEFERVSEEVRKITHYVGESVIVLLFFEPPTVKCSERNFVQKWFRKNGVEIREWNVSDLGIDGEEVF